MDTSGITTMLCASCGRPVVSAVWVGSRAYHEECTHGPGWQPQYFRPPPLSAEDVRRIVREELERAGSAAAAGVKAPDSALSDFIRNASPEQKAEVYGKVMGKVAVRQQAVIDGVKENGNG